MKKMKIIGSLLLLFTAITFTSCENEPIDPAIDLTNPGNNSGQFTAKIGSDNFNANQLIDAELKDTPLGTQLTVIGVTTAGKTMSIVVMNPAIGTRTATSNESSLLTFDYAASANDIYSSYNTTTSQYSGVLTISQFNLVTKKISATFSYTGYGALSSATQIQVTDGKLTNIIFDDLTTGGNNPNPNPTAVFKADFNNATWNATQYQAIVSGNIIQIVGTKSNGETFAFLIDGATTGTYPANDNLLSYTPSNSEYSYWSNNISNPTENTGSITISNINTTTKTISGTFSFKGYWSDADVTTIPPVQFTNGVFTNIPYINQVETGDTFYAKVDGVEFVDVDILTAEFSTNNQDWLSIAAQNAASNSITVSVRSNVTVGTYPITGNVAVDNAQGVYSLDSGTDYNSISGSVTILSKTADHIKGTFNFVASNGTESVTISAGEFDVDY